MGHLQRLDRVEERAHDRPGRETVTGDLVVQGELQGAVLEGRGAARVDALHPEPARGGDVEGHEVADRVRTLAVTEQLQQVVVVAHHGERAPVEERDVREFELGAQRMGRRHRRLHGGGVAHPRVGRADPGRRAARMGEGVPLRGRLAHVEFGQQQPRGDDVAARDVRVHLDAAGHDHAARRVDHPVGLAPRRLDDMAVLDPHVADGVAGRGRIDDAPAPDHAQHAVSLLPARRCASWPMTAAADGRSAGAPAP